MSDDVLAVGGAWGPPARRPAPLHGTDRDWIEGGTHFRMAGDGPAVVLIHGVGLDLFMWDDIVTLLARDFTVLRYDMLGHGRSAKPPGARVLGDFQRQLTALMDAYDMRRAAVVGKRVVRQVQKT